MNDLGWRYLAQRMDTLLPPELLKAIDPVPFGKYAMREEQGHFTEHGYISLSGDEWEHERPAEPEKKPSGNGWNRARRNVRRKTRRSPIRKSLRQICKEVISGGGGQCAVLLERADALYGEQLQLAPGGPYRSGVAGAGSTVAAE